MSSRHALRCSICGTPVSHHEELCKHCGAALIRSHESSLDPVQPEMVAEKPYERKFSLAGRLWRLLVSPSDAMRDIALAPDYAGVIGIIVLRVIVAVFVVWVVLQKIHFVGNSRFMSAIWSFLTLGLILGVGLAGVVLVVFWLAKAWLVKNACDNSSGWNFKTAAAVTGYAYIADFIVGIIGLFVAAYFLPNITFDLSDLNATRQALLDYQNQINATRWLYTLPLTFIGVIWKSYLGGLGTHFGTKERCLLGKAFAVFLLLGLIGVLIGFLGTF